jgi:hypothetical protein
LSTRHWNELALAIHLNETENIVSIRSHSSGW